MEENQIKKSNKGLILIVILILIGLTGYIVYDKVINKEEKEITTEKKDKQDNKIDDNKINNKISSYEVKDEENSCKRLFINGNETQIFGNFDVLKFKSDDYILVEGTINSCENFINGHYYIVTANKNITAINGTDEIDNSGIPKVIVTGKNVRNINVDNNKIVVTSDNGGQEPLNIAESMDNKDMLFEFVDELTYNSNGSFSLKTIKKTTVEDYLKLHK